MKALKVKLSGSYMDSKNELSDYEVEGVIPFVDEDRAHQVCKNRYSAMWIAKKTGGRPKKVREVFLDSCKETTAELSFMGKSIKEMGYEEIQDLATAYSLKLPLYKTGSIRSQREKALSEYMLKVKGVPEEKVKRVMELRFDDMPDLKPTMEDETKPVETKSLTEELSEFGVKLVEAESEVGNEEYTLEDLKNIAKAKGIKFSPNIGLDTLKKRVFE